MVKRTRNLNTFLENFQSLLLTSELGDAEANPGRVTRVTRIGANASGRTTARHNAKSNPGKINKVTRIGAKASGQTTDRRTSTYVTGNSYVPNRQGVGKPKTNDNRYSMSNQVRIE